MLFRDRYDYTYGCRITFDLRYRNSIFSVWPLHRLLVTLSVSACGRRRRVCSVPNYRVSALREVPTRGTCHHFARVMLPLQTLC